MQAAALAERAGPRAPKDSKIGPGNNYLEMSNNEKRN